LPDRQFSCGLCDEVYEEHWYGMGPYDFTVTGPYGELVPGCRVGNRGLHDFTVTEKGAA
jgi:hypothetical protein